MQHLWAWVAPALTHDIKRLHAIKLCLRLKVLYRRIRRTPLIFKPWPCLYLISRKRVWQFIRKTVENHTTHRTRPAPKAMPQTWVDDNVALTTKVDTNTSTLNGRGDLNATWHPRHAQGCVHSCCTTPSRSKITRTRCINSKDALLS